MLPDERVNTEGKCQESEAHGCAACPTTFQDITTNEYDLELTEILQKHVFVGVVDVVRELSVVQVLKKLYLVNHGTLSYVPYSERRLKSDPPCFGSEELFYQLGLRQFGNFPKLKLEPPAPLRPLIKLAIDAEKNTELSNLSKPQIVDVRTFNDYSFSLLP